MAGTEFPCARRETQEQPSTPPEHRYLAGETLALDMRDCLHVPDTRHNAHALANRLARLADQLDPGESLCVSIQAQPGRQPSWSLASEVGSWSPKAAAQMQRRLRARIAAGLAGSPLLELGAPARAPARGPSYPVQAPAIILSPSTVPIGFATPPDDRSPPRAGLRVVVSVPQQQVQHSIVRAIASSSGAALWVRASCRELTREQSVGLADLVRALRAGRFCGVDADGGVATDRESLLGWADDWADALAGLLAHRRLVGVEVGVTLDRKDLDMAWALAREVWPGAAASRGARVDAPGLLDLRWHGLATELLARLFPHDAADRRAAWDAATPVHRRPGGPALRLGHDGSSDVLLSAAAASRHLHVVGGTGTGKSSLLLDLALQDAAARRGLIVVDPHGDLVDAILERLPPWRRDDLRLFDPGDPDRAPGLNFLAPVSGDRALDASMAASELLDIVGQLYDMDRAGGPVFEQYFRAALQLLVSNTLDGLTLCELPAVFENPAFRRRLMATCTRPELRDFWAGQAERATGDLSLAALAPYITSKLYAFTHHPLLRAIVGQSADTIDLARAMDDRGIVLVNLSRGRLGLRESALLGMLLVSRLFRTAMARTTRPHGERTSFSVYIDEVQTCLSDHVAAALCEARKAGLRLVLAHQHLAQIDHGVGRNNLLQAVLANAGNLVACRLGPADAERLQPYFGPDFVTGDLCSLPDFRAIVRIGGDQRPQRPALVELTRPAPAAADGLRHRASVRHDALQRSAKPRDEVDREIAARRTLHLRADSA